MYLISNIPHFKCWVRREFTHNHEQYHDEYLHALAYCEFYESRLRCIYDLLEYLPWFTMNT